MHSSTEIVSSLEDLEHVLRLCGTYNIGILELPGGLKIVKNPDNAPTLEPRGPDGPETVRAIHDDPFLYSDGHVPEFTR